MGKREAASEGAACGLPLPPGEQRAEQETSTLRWVLHHPEHPSNTPRRKKSMNPPKKQPAPQISRCREAGGHRGTWCRGDSTGGEGKRGGWMAAAPPSRLRSTITDGQRCCGRPPTETPLSFSPLPSSPCHLSAGTATLWHGHQEGWRPRGTGHQSWTWHRDAAGAAQPVHAAFYFWASQSHGGDKKVQTQPGKGSGESINLQGEVESRKGRGGSSWGRGTGGDRGR